MDAMRDKLIEKLLTLISQSAAEQGEIVRGAHLEIDALLHELARRQIDAQATEAIIARLSAQRAVLICAHQQGIDRLLRGLGNAAAQVVQLHPGTRSRPAAVIRTYYQRRAHNPKITLKQICAELGANYASVRVVKVAYDRRRRRGRKR